MYTLDNMHESPTILRMIKMSKSFLKEKYQLRTSALQNLKCVDLPIFPFLNIFEYLWYNMI